MELTPSQTSENSEGILISDQTIFREGNEDCQGSYYYYNTGKGNGTLFDGSSKCRDVHNYYQWVPYVLVLMGLMFKLPNKLWKYLEEEKIDSIVKGIKNDSKYSKVDHPLSINNIYFN